MIKWSKLFLIVVLTPYAAVAQNLVPNAGFEAFLTCPGYFSDTPAALRVPHWYSAGRGTPDHFHACSRGEADVPYNWAGVADAFEGEGYAGVYVWIDGARNYREYLQCKLTTPLVPDSTYKVSFRYKLSSYSRYAIDRMGLLLSDSAVRVTHDETIRCVPTLSVIQDSALTPNTGYWEIARLEYKARGGEQYITIGNFFDNASTRYYKIRFTPNQQEMLSRASYYYVDDVQVVPKYIPGVPTIPGDVPLFGVDEIVRDKTYVMQNIHFTFNSYRLLTSSFEELDQLVAWLAQHPQINIELHGHTDDQGSDQYNMTLSRNRAHTVSLYLIQKGIAASRIQTMGFGKRKPLVKASTEAARQINRRVEVSFH